MRLALISLALAALAACSSPETNAPGAGGAETTPATLGGVDLNQPMRAIGTEPFWSVEVTPTTLAYSAPDSPGLRADNPGPTIQGTTAVYAAAGADGTALVVTLIATECSDGMSDRTYPLTARVEVGNQTLNGCAASVAFLESEPRP